MSDASSDLGKGDVFSGDVAFKLYDTYGFPLDLTEDALRTRGIAVDHAAFNAAMEQQKAEARKAWKGSGEAATETVWFEVRDKVGATEFLGYDTEAAEGEILSLIKDGKPVKTLKANPSVSKLIMRGGQRRAPTTLQRTFCMRLCARCLERTLLRRARWLRQSVCGLTSHIPSR